MTIVHTCNLTLLQVRHEIVHGATHFLIDDAVVQPLHVQIGGHICHRDKFGIDAHHDLQILVIHDDVRRLKLTKFNEIFFILLTALQRILSDLERFSDTHNLLVCTVAFPFCDRINFIACTGVYVTLVCPIQRDGCPRPGADMEPGLALAQAEERKSRTYPEFGQQGRCKLVVLALEVGGRWSTATQTFLRALARGRALASPSHSRAALAHALQRRWGQMLAVAANTAFSSSLLELPATAVPSAGALPPPLAEVVADARWT